MSKVQSVHVSRSVGFFWRPGVPGDRELHGIRYRRLSDGVTCVCDGDELRRLVKVAVSPAGTKTTSCPLAGCDFFTWQVVSYEGDLDRGKRLRLWHNFVNLAMRQLKTRIRERAGR